MLRYYSENGPEHYVPIQKKLIEQAYQMLAEGGELLYSTCTFSVKENEEVIAGLLDAHPDMEVQEITPGYEGFAPGVSVNGRDLSRCVHIFPQRMEGEGHFVALLKKQGESRKRQPSRLLETTKKLPKEAEEFLAGVRMDWKNGSFALVKEMCIRDSSRASRQDKARGADRCYGSYSLSGQRQRDRRRRRR